MTINPDDITPEMADAFLPQHVAEFLQERPHVAVLLDVDTEIGGVVIHEALLKDDSEGIQMLRVHFIDALEQAKHALTERAVEWFADHSDD